MVKEGAYKRVPFHSRWFLGYDVRVPVDQAVVKMWPYERDEWAAAELKRLGFKPLATTYSRMVYEGHTDPVAFIITTYVSRKEAYVSKSGH